MRISDWSSDVCSSDLKRHPTLGDGVIVGANATILGPVKVGSNARVGANAVVLKDVPEGCTAVGVPARIIRPQNRGQEARFLPYGTPCADMPATVARGLRGQVGQVTSLRQKGAREEGDTPAAAGRPRRGAN